MSEIKIITNNQYREIIYGCELTSKEKEEFDFLEKDNLEMDQFFRYKGDVHYIGNYINLNCSTDSMYYAQNNNDKDHVFKNWHGVQNDSYFSGTLIKLGEDGDNVMVGRYYS